MDHTANLRNNIKVSAIWHHGGEPRCLDDDSMTGYWRYAYCTGSAIVLRNGMVTGAVTGYPIVPRARTEARLITVLLGNAALVEDDVEQPIFYSPKTA